MLEQINSFLNRLFNRLNIKQKYIVIIIPCLVISYCSIFISFYVVFDSQTRQLVTRQATRNMEDKTNSLSQYFKNLTEQTDILLYNSNNNTTYDIQNAFVTLSSELEREDYMKRYDIIQKSLYDFTLTPNSYSQNINNAYILTHYGELVSKNTMYYSTAENFLSLTEQLQNKAEKLHGKLCYEYDPAFPNKLTIARAVFQWTSSASFQTVDNQVAFFMAEIDLAPLKNILKSGTDDAIHYILLDDHNIPVLNQSELDLKFDELQEESAYRDGQYTFQVMSHKFDNDYQLVTLLNETLLYENIEQTIRTQAVTIGVFIILIFVGILFASSNISRQFQLFIETIGSVDKLDEQALIHIDSKDEFAKLSVVYNEMITRIAALNEKVYLSELLAQKADLEAFQAQINPHFLYNTLDCINSLADLGKIEETKQTVTALGNIMRMTIKGENFLPLRRDMEFIRQFLFIQKMRYQEKILFLIEVPETMMDYVIPKLVIQPVLENAIIHGVSDLLGQGMIALFGHEEDNDLIFEVKDNGVGIPDDTIRSLEETAEKLNELHGKKSIGLLNTQKRIHLLYGNRYGLQARRLESGGSCVTIRLPKCTEEKEYTHETFNRR